MKDWSVDRWFGAGGVALGILGILVAIFTWRKSIVDVRPYYRVYVHRLIGPYAADSPFNTTDASLTVHYRDKVSTQVSKIFVVFWNRGRETLEWKSAAIPEEPLELVLPEGTEFLGSPKVTACTRASNRFSASVHPSDPRRATLSFVFLDRMDGAVVELLCGGPTKGYEISGAFMSSRSLHNDGKYALIAKRSYRDRFLGTVARATSGVGEYTVPAVMTILSLGLFVMAITSEHGNSFPGAILAAFFCVLVFTISLLLIAAFFDGGGSAQVKFQRLPRELRRIPIEPEYEKSDAKSKIVRLMDDYRAIRRRERAKTGLR